jgi:hypothetical protein
MPNSTKNRPTVFLFFSFVIIPSVVCGFCLGDWGKGGWGGWVVGVWINKTMVGIHSPLFVGLFGRLQSLSV